MAPTPATGRSARSGHFRQGRNPDGRMRFVEHLIEFRRRLVISMIGILLGMIGGWLLTVPALDAMRVPIAQIATERTGGASINFTNVTSAFDIRLQMALTLGVVLSAPVWLYQAWMFLMPGLKRTERIYALGFLGSAIPLFLAGCWTGWLLMPRIVELMASFAPVQDTVFFDAKYYYTFVLQLCLAVGIAFVVPVLLVMLNFAGVLAGRTILRSWRYAILGTALFAAIATPAADVLSMFLLMVPMLGLYFAAVGIALLNDRRRAKRETRAQERYERELRTGGA